MQVTSNVLPATNTVNQSRCNSLYNRCPVFIQAAFMNLKKACSNRCWPVLIGLVATVPVLLSSKIQEIAARTLQIASPKHLILASATAIICLWTAKKYLLTSNTASIDRIRCKPRLEGKRTVEQKDARAKELEGIKQQLEDPSLNITTRIALIKEYHACKLQRGENRLDPLQQDAAEFDEYTLSDLERDLKDVASYKGSQKNIIAIVDAATQMLLKRDISKSEYEFANTVYQLITDFLITHTYPEDPDKIGSKYTKELIDNDARITTHNRTTYNLLLYKLGDLRKQIKLRNPWVLIKSKLAHIPCSPKTTQGVKWLGVTWAHGTKASVIAVASAHFQGQLVPTGDLQKSQQVVDAFTGERERGSSAKGVNQDSLSGTSLLHAEDAVYYANRFKFDASNELEFVKKFLQTKSNDLCDDDDGYFSRIVLALQRVKTLMPAQFNKDLIRNKRDEIHKQLAEIVTKNEPNLFLKGRKGLMFYSFLNALDRLDELLNDHLVVSSDLDLQKLAELATIPVVLASTTIIGEPFGQEMSEVTYQGRLKLGKDINVVFTPLEHMQTVQTVVSRCNLASSLRVVPITVLETALKIEKSLKHSDIYGLEGPFCGLEYVLRLCGSQFRRTFKVLKYCKNRCYITTKRQVT